MMGRDLFDVCAGIVRDDLAARRRLADERRVVVVLYPRLGRVSNVVPLHKPTAPVPSDVRPGA